MGGLVSSSAFNVNAAESLSDADVSIYKAYNLNTGNGEIGLYSYRNIISASSFSDFGVGYADYYTTTTRWQENPLLVETSGNSDAEWVIGDKFSGEFSFVGRGLQTDYAEGGSSQMDYKTLTFHFEAAEQTCSVVFKQAENTDTITVSGLYNGLNVSAKAPTVKSSLCGKSEGKDMPLYFSFDATTGMVYVRNDIGREKDTLVLDFSASGYVPMEYYQASVAFSDIAEKVVVNEETYDAKGRLLVYEICGQPLSGVQTNWQGAQITSFDNAQKIYFGAQYKIGDAIAYDVLDGDISSNIVKRVFAPNGETVVIANNTFAVNQVGEYTIEYSIQDNDGIESKAEYTLLAVDELPTFTCVLEKNYPETCGIGEKVYLLDALIKSNSTVYEYDVMVLNGNNVVKIQEDQYGKYIAPSKDGVYQFVYIVKTDIGLLKTFAYEMVCEKATGFFIDKIAEQLSYNVPYDFGSPYAVWKNETYPLTLEVTDPDGEQTVLTETFVYTPKKIGQYQLRFYAEVEGKTYERIMSVTCIYANSSLFESVVGIDNIQNNYSVTAFERVVSNPSSGSVTKTLTTRTGVLLTGSGTNQTFRFKNSIDLTKISATTPIIDMFVLAGGDYASLSSLKVRLIDKYDSKNSVTVLWSQHESDYYCYVRAGAGVNEFGRSNIQNANNVVEIYRRGTVTLNTLCGSTVKGLGLYGQSKYNTFGFCFDYRNKAINVCNARPWSEPEYYTVIDLDDMKQVGNAVWNGFTTGECYVEVIMPGQLSNAGVVVFEVAGQALSGVETVDSTEPVIYSDIRYNTTQLPDVALNEMYPIPNLKANDLVDGELATQVQVVDPYGQEVNIVNGSIIPSVIGEYKIVYSAADRSGNKSTKTHTFNVISNIDPIDICWATEIGEYIVGDTVVIPEVMIIGGSGNIENVEFEVLLNGKPIELPISRIITLNEWGQLTITLKSAEDYIGSKINGTVLKIMIDAPTKPTLKVEGLPEYFIEGQLAYLPFISATDYFYAEGDALRNSVVSVFVDGQKVEGEYFKVPAGDELTLTIVAGSGERVESLEYIVPIQKPTKITDYFVQNGSVDMKVSDNGTLFTMSKGASVSLVNPVVSNELTIGLQLSAYGEYYDNAGTMQKYTVNIPDAIEITLTDFYNPYYAIHLKFTPCDDEYSYIQINGGKKLQVLGSFISAKAYTESIKISIKDNGKLLDNNNLLYYDIETFLNGEKFTGFPSGVVSLSFSLDKYSGAASFFIDQIGNQVFDYFSYEYGDATAPMLWTDVEMKTASIMKGEVIPIAAAKAYDVLSYYGNVTVRVTMPNAEGTIATYLNNAFLKETQYITAEYSGIYSIYYTVADEFGNQTVYTYRYSVIDTSAPIITIKGNIKETYKVGEEMYLPEVYATSPSGANVVCKVLIYNASTRYTIVEGDSVVLKKGDYKLVVYAYDENYNFAEEVIEFTVEG